MATFGTTDTVVTMWIQAKGGTCNVHVYTTGFKTRLNGRSYVECRSIYIFPAATPQPNWISS